MIDAPMLNLVVRRTIRAPATFLFDAWTQPERLTAWWGPANVECVAAQVDLRVGGHYRIANRFPDGTILWIAGEYLQIVRPTSLVFTWRLEQGDDLGERVSVRFEARGDVTDIVVAHERIANAALRDGHEQGWFGCLDGLATYASAQIAVNRAAED